MNRIRVALCQKSLGVPITRRDIGEMQAFRPHFVCFPEYFFVNRRLGNHGQTPHNQALQIRRIRSLSRELDATVIGGTMPELADGTMYNTSYVFHRGEMLGFYRKRNLFFAEVGKLTPGDSYRIFLAQGITFGVMICADIFDESGFRFMREKGARVIFSPTFSLRKEETPEEKYRRDNDIYVSGASLSGAVIVKVCGVKSEYKSFLQARSLIAGPDGVRFRVAPEEEETEMIILREVEI
ncbi:MAG: carbon-nitrogen hydrolase family protein [Spirochaetes bacterium]|nr:carbon-nitrogen hydrolase family protein [Spirochaetota bacterium]